VLLVLKEASDVLQDEDYGVSLWIMVTELWQLSPASVIGCLESVINSHVYCLLPKWDIAWHWGTHKAQNSQHLSEVIGEILEYVVG
jgi:hypothetical protein